MYLLDEALKEAAEPLSALKPVAVQAETVTETGISIQNGVDRGAQTLETALTPP